MEIVHQKLIMLLASSMLAILLFKLDLSRLVANRFTAAKIKSGVIMILAASLLGVLAKMGIFGRMFAASSFEYFLDTIVGYIFGLSLLIWGLYVWSKEHVAVDEITITSSRQRRLSERLTEELLKNQNLDSLLIALSRPFLLALDCQALTYHQKCDRRHFQMRFHHGLSQDSASQLAMLSLENELFSAMLREKQAITSDLTPGLFSHDEISSSDGPIKSVFAVPIIVANNDTSILTIYSVRKRHFTSDDLQLLEGLRAALAVAIVREKAEEEYRRAVQEKEMVEKLAEIFHAGDSVVDSFLKASRLIYQQYQFDDISLFIHGNGPVENYDFQLPDGGMAYHKSGYFAKADFPQLYGRRKETRHAEYSIASYSRLTRDFSSLIIRLGEKDTPLAHLEIRQQGYVKIPALAFILMNKLGQMILQKLMLQKTKLIESRATQWMAALQYGHEKALALSNLSELLDEMANFAVELTPVTFCRIFLSNPEKAFLRTAAQAQRRALSWPLRHIEEIPIAELPLHQRALLENSTVSFSDNADNSQISAEEASLVLPTGTRHGVIIPITIENQAVGLFTVGELRKARQNEMPRDFELFISNLASLISLALSWHKEKRNTAQIREGARKLTMRNSQSQDKYPEHENSLNMRSRINGPLAGILASCEYLKGSQPRLEGDIVRFIEIIERNATKIHGITSDFSEGMNVSAIKP